MLFVARWLEPLQVVGSNGGQEVVRFQFDRLTQLINAIRGHLSEYGLIAPQGPFHVEKLIAEIEDPASDLPQAARTCLSLLVDPCSSMRFAICRK
jgi:hypothetical protein